MKYLLFILIVCSCTKNTDITDQYRTGLNVTWENWCFGQPGNYYNVTAVTEGVREGKDKVYAGYIFNRQMLNEVNIYAGNGTQIFRVNTPQDCCGGRFYIKIVFANGHENIFRSPKDSTCAKCELLK